MKKKFLQSVLFLMTAALLANESGAKPENDHYKENDLYHSMADVHLKSALMDYEHRLDSVVTQEYNNTKTYWYNQSKRHYQFNKDNLLSQEIYSKWNNTDSAWVGSSKTTYVYDTKGREVEDTYYIWNSTDSAWIPRRLEKTEYTADGLGITSYWSYYTNNAWKKAFRIDQTLNAAGNVTLYVAYFRSADDKSWIESSQITRNYNVHQKELGNIEYSYSTTDRKFVQTVKTDYYYDTKGFPKYYISQKWDKTAGKYINSTRFEETYNANGNLLLKVGYNPSNDDWVPNSKTTYSYDYHGNRNKLEYYKYKNQTWDLSYMYEYSFDTEHKRKSILMPDYIPADSLKSMETGYVYKTWNASQQALLKNVRELYYYRKLAKPVMISEVDQSSVKVFPNPSPGTVFIEMPQTMEKGQINIFDMQGRKVCYSELTEGSNILQLNNLSKGIYIYSITINGLTENGKIMLIE
jgi:hypothetical protein